MANQITPNPSVPSQVVAEVKFPKFINNLGIIPTSYKDSMSYYETLAWLCKFLEEQVIPTVNENGEAVEELQALYVELNSYVTDYFDNLDVQEEINNKLDDMVEAGTLQEIITEYLNSKALFCFDTVQDMKEATNLIDGSYAKTLGYYNINDGGGAIYYITENQDTSKFYEELENENYAYLVEFDELNLQKVGIQNNHNITLKLKKALSLYTKIIIPNGTFIVKDLNLTNNYHEIIGLENSKLILTPDTGKYGMYANEPNIIFKNLILEGGQALKSNTSIDYGRLDVGGALIRLGYHDYNHGKYVKFENCKFYRTDYENFAGTYQEFGVFVIIMNFKRLEIINCYSEHTNELFRGVGNYPELVFKTTNINEIIIRDNRFNAVDSPEVLINHSSSFNIDNEPFSKHGLLSDYSYIQNNQIISEVFADCQGIGIGYIKNSIIENNTIKNYDTCFDVDNPYNIKITNNNFIGNANDYGEGLRIAGAVDLPKNIIIKNNYFEYYKNAIYSYIPQNIIIDSNIVENCNYLFYCYNDGTTVNDIKIENNICKLNNSVFDMRSVIKAYITNNEFTCSDNTKKMFILQFTITDVHVNNNTFINYSNGYTVQSENSIVSECQNNIGINNKTHKLFTGSYFPEGTKFIDGVMLINRIIDTNIDNFFAYNDSDIIINLGNQSLRSCKRHVFKNITSIINFFMQHAFISDTSNNGIIECYNPSENTANVGLIFTDGDHTNITLEPGNSVKFLLYNGVITDLV